LGNADEILYSNKMLPSSSSNSNNSSPQNYHEPSESRIDATDTIAKILQKKVYSNYITVAYCLVLGTYFCAFTLYLYLRLASIIFPERFVYRRACEVLKNETIVRNGIHYGSITVTFITITLIQCYAFFLLTISSTYINFERRYRNFNSMEDQLLLELRYNIRKIMYESILPTFLVYSLTSLVILSSIFYMVGLRDEVVDTVSQVFVYFFDGCVLFYFIIFPLISFIYHPDIQCSFVKCYSNPSSDPPVPSAAAAAHLTSFRIITEDSNNNITSTVEPENLRIRTITSL
jgi:hypothetical protein